MRNLKKILALVLALVMSFSLMATANAFTDSDKINGTYEEAVEVLSALKVFQGYENGSFVPQGSITRAEVAAIIYRIVTGDVADKQVGIYADYNKFNDVKSTSWYAGYVNFCANAEYIKGYDAKTFGPNDPVTGYQALAMILRAVGYDKNGEFTGTGWQTQTAAVGKKLGITNNVSEGTLGVAATREVVAEILFRSILVPQVEYTVAFGYQSIGQVSIGYETFKLLPTYVDGADKWGRPSHNWMLDANNNRAHDAADKLLVAVALDPVATYETAVTECQVAQDVGFTGTKTYTVYTNGIANKTSDTLYSNNTVNTIGAQGRLTLVYTDRIVYIDTLLAEVTAVRNAVLDAAGHVVTPATITMKVYDADNAFTVVTLANGGTNYTYTVGNMLLVYAVQNGQGKVVTNTNVATLTQQHVEILGVAESFVGAQSTIWANIAKHVIGGTEYPDNNRFHLDQAGRDLTNHTWYKDTKGNLIGATDIISTNYAVLKNIRWIVGAPGHVEATLVDLTGNETTVTVATIDGIDGNGFATANDDARVAYRAHDLGAIKGKVAYVSDELLYNRLYEGYGMFRVDTNLDGSVNLEGAENGVAIVTYLKDANFNANASAIMKSANMGGGIATYVSSNTQYLVKGANNTYTAITGTQAMTSYAKADIFYVDTNKDSIADYVYIRTGELAGASEALIYVTTTAYTWGLTDGKYTWTMKATVNGQADQTVTAVTDQAAGIDGEAIMKQLASGLNTLYKATLDPATGNVKTVQQITTSHSTPPVTVNGMTVDYIAVPRVIDGYTLVGAGAGESYRVDNATVVGTKTDLGSINTYTDGIWVVYTSNVYNTASAVYVGQKVANTTGENAVIADAAKKVLTGATYADIYMPDATQAAVEAQLVAQINAKLVAAGVVLPKDSKIAITIYQDTDNDNDGQIFFQYQVTVGTAPNAVSFSIGNNTVIVHNSISKTAIENAIISKLGASKALKANMTPAEYTKAVTDVITTYAGVPTFTVSTVVITEALQAGNTVNVTVTGIDTNFGAMTINARMTVQP